MDNDLSNVKLPVVKIGVDMDSALNLGVMVFVLILITIVLNIYLKKIL